MKAHVYVEFGVRNTKLLSKPLTVRDESWDIYLFHFIYLFCFSLSLKKKPTDTGMLSTTLCNAALIK